jgi:CMP-N,N'-diacetyllegionaminic acid synthase
VINNKRLLALIPARSGSKRLPHKNSLNLGGKPLIAWSIDAGLQSKYVDRVVVSTDSNAIAAMAKQYGADIPFIRPEILASDTATTIDVVRHAMSMLEKKMIFMTT